jgi:hypothetical protein
VRRLRILTWHVHGSYLQSLGALDHDIVVPVKAGRPARYGGRPDDAAWPASIREVPAEAVRSLDVDVVLYQSPANWLEDQHELLSDAQRRGPRVYVEHDPPREHPTDTVHPVHDPDVLVVHVTNFNALMWDNGPSPVRVVEHGIVVPEGLTWTGDVARGLVVVNDLATRGRRLGADLVARARERLPIDVAGLRSEAIGGLGALSHRDLLDLEARYRFFFHPARYTSFGMAVCEAMLLGSPVVALATTEMPTVIENGRNGFTSTDPAVLEAAMAALLEDRGLAHSIGTAGRQTARERFSIERFVAAWNAVLAEAVGDPTPARSTARSSPDVEAAGAGSAAEGRFVKRATQAPERTGRRAADAARPRAEINR